MRGFISLMIYFSKWLRVVDRFFGTNGA